MFVNKKIGKMKQVHQTNTIDKIIIHGNGQIPASHFLSMCGRKREKRKVETGRGGGRVK